MPQTSASYRPPARLLHWSMAVLVIAMLLVGQKMIQEGLPRSQQDALFIFHKNMGVLILLLVLVRLAYRAAHPPPPLPASVPPLQARAAHVTHWLLYALLIAMPVTGYIRVKAGGFPIEYLDALGVPSLVPKSEPLANAAKAAHFYLRIVLAGLIAVHVGAALHHAFVRQDGVLARMWPGSGR